MEGANRRDAIWRAKQWGVDLLMIGCRSCGSGRLFLVPQLGMRVLDGLE